MSSSPKQIAFRFSLLCSVMGGLMIIHGGPYFASLGGGLVAVAMLPALGEIFARSPAAAQAGHFERVALLDMSSAVVALLLGVGTGAAPVAGIVVTLSMLLRAGCAGLQRTRSATHPEKLAWLFRPLTALLLATAALLLASTKLGIEDLDSAHALHDAGWLVTASATVSVLRFAGLSIDILAASASRRSKTAT